MAISGDLIKNLPFDGFVFFVFNINQVSVSLFINWHPSFSILGRASLLGTLSGRCGGCTCEAVATLGALSLE